MEMRAGQMSTASVTVVVYIRNCIAIFISSPTPGSS